MKLISNITVLSVFLRAFRRRAISDGAVLASGMALWAGPAKAVLVETKAFYSEHCARCHKEGKAKGGFRMDELLSRPTVEGHDDPWKNVLEKLAGREMPPDEEEKLPTHDDYEKQIARLRGELEKSEQATAALVLAQPGTLKDDGKRGGSEKEFCQ